MASQRRHEACFPPKVIKIFNRMLTAFNDRQVEMPNGTGKRIRFHMLSRDKSLFDVSLDAEPGWDGTPESKVVEHQRPPIDVVLEHEPV